MVGGIWEKTTRKRAIKTLRVVQPCSGRSFGGDGFQIAFGNQTIFLPALSDRTKEEDSRLCVPTSRQVCLYRCNRALKELPRIQAGQTELNIVNRTVSTVILKAWAGVRNRRLKRPADYLRAYSGCQGPACNHPFRGR
jgi:hypothetical protein